LKKLFFLVWLIATVAKAEDHYSIDGGYRSLPKGANLVATAAWDGLLWGDADKQKPLYGYYRVGARLGGTPTAAAFVQVAPIAPVILEVQHGFTDRFSKMGPFDCDTYDCFGKVERTDYSLRLVGGYKDLVFMGTMLSRNIQTAESNKAIALELENLTIRPGKEKLVEGSLMAGYKLNPTQVVGLLYNRGTLDETHQGYAGAYAFYRFSWQDFAWTAAVGNYQSDHPDLSGTSVLLGVSRRWGEVLSLF
jgi:hypothetical protein